MVLLSLAIVFAGIGIFSATGSDDSSPTAAAADVTTTAAAAAPQQPAASAPATEQPATGQQSETTQPSTTSAAPAADTLRVLNNSNVQGLAAETATELQSAGFTVAETGNYASGTIATSTVYYDPAVPGQQAEAERVATTLGFSVEPRFDGIASSTPGIIVIVTQ